MNTSQSLITLFYTASLLLSLIGCSTDEFYQNVEHTLLSCKEGLIREGAECITSWEYNNRRCAKTGHTWNGEKCVCPTGQVELDGKCLAPSPSPQPVPSPTPMPIPTPIPIPLPGPTPSPVPTPVPAPNPSPVPTPIPVPNPIPGPAPTPIPFPPNVPPECSQALQNVQQSAVINISTENQLRSIQSNKNYRLINNITLTGALPNSSSVIKNILLDGNGHTISGIGVTSAPSNAQYVGILPRTQCAYIHDLQFRDFNIPDLRGYSVGLISGEMNYVSVKNVNVDRIKLSRNDLDTGAGYVGAIAGGATFSLFSQIQGNQVELSFTAPDGTPSRNQYSVGGIAGYMTGNISDSAVSGKVIANYAGGIVGSAADYYAPSSLIIRTRFKGTVGGFFAGGIAGVFSNGKIEQSSTEVSLYNFFASNSGGLVAQMVEGAGKSAQITRSQSKVLLIGNGTAGSTFGGLVALAYSLSANSISLSQAEVQLDAATQTDYRIWANAWGGFIGAGYNLKSGAIANCFSRGDLMATYATAPLGMGGFLGRSSANEPQTIQNSYSSVSLLSYASRGGFIGYGDPGNNPNVTQNCYWDTTTTSASNWGNATGKTAAELKLQSTFSNWDFVTIWEMPAAGGFPKLRN